MNIINTLWMSLVGGISRRGAEKQIYNKVIDVFDVWVSFRDTNSAPYDKKDVDYFCERLDNISIENILTRKNKIYKEEGNEA